MEPTDDVDNNVIEYKQFDYNKLQFVRNSKYDKHGNVIESLQENRNYKNVSTNKARTLYDYNYNKYECSIMMYDEKDSLQEYRGKRFYNKKGLIIEEKSKIRKDYNLHSQIVYDKNGNVLKRSSLDGNLAVKSFSEFKYKFDEKGNIILIEQFYNDKLLSKTLVKIIYW